MLEKNKLKKINILLYLIYYAVTNEKNSTKYCDFPREIALFLSLVILMYTGFEYILSFTRIYCEGNTPGIQSRVFCSRRRS